MEAENEVLIDQVESIDPYKKIGDKISRYCIIRKNAKESLKKVKSSIEKFQIKYPWFGVANELILKFESDKSWDSILSNPSTEGFFSYYSSFIDEKNCSQDEELPKPNRRQTRTRGKKASKSNQMTTLWDKYKYEFIRIGLGRLSEKYRILLDSKQKLESDIEIIKEMELLMDEFTGIYETKIEEDHEKIKKLQETSLRLSEIEKNLGGTKNWSRGLLSDNSLTSESLQKFETCNGPKRYEALDTDIKENGGVRTKAYRNPGKLNPYYQKSKTREIIDELRSLYLSKDQTNFNSLISEYILIDPHGLKKALNRFNYDDLTNFNPFLENLPESSIEAENLAPREPKFQRKLCDWEDSKNLLPWETRLIFPHLTVYDMCTTLKYLKRGTLDFDFTVKYLPQYPWFINTLTTPPNRSLSLSQQSYILSLIPKCKLSVCSESNSTVIQIYRDNLECVLFNRNTKFYRKDKLVDFKSALVSNYKSYN